MPDPRFVEGETRVIGNRWSPRVHAIKGAEATHHLERLTIRNVRTGETETVPANGLFVFIGATPRTEWLADLGGR